MRSALLDGDVIAFLAGRRCRTAEEFGVDPDDDPSPELEWEKPEYPGTAGTPPIVVRRDEPDWWRIRYQIAHEVFHWLCAPPRTFHWAHELFAVEMAVRALEELGEHDYAERSIATLAEEAELLSLEAMLTTTFREAYPDGLYGRAWLTGRELSAAPGWERLKSLARSFDEHGKPDVAAWVNSFPPEERAKVDAMLGTPSPTWV